MKYIARELLQGVENVHAYKDLEIRECSNAFAAKNFVDELLSKNYELRLKRQKKDYDTIVQVELYFERKGKVQNK